jgi:two-component system, OmpR family, response regulator BaeR
MAGTILIVEDEPKLAALLRDYLRAAGMESVIVERGDKAIEVFRETDPSLVVLDLMLPGEDGISICRKLRETSRVPVIMVTARVEEVDRLLGLQVGADDYVCKPYSPREVVARVQAQLRRQRWTEPATQGGATGDEGMGPLVIDDQAMRANLADAVLDVTPAEFRILRQLTRRPGQVLSRDQLLDALHDDGRAVTDRAVDSHIRNLRRKLELAGAPGDPIRSVYGVGYAWEWPSA